MRLFSATVYWVTLLFSMLMGCSEQSVISLALRRQALSELRNNVDALGAWEKVHAAEYLIALGYPEKVRDIFLREEARHGREVPYRIGIWRVLARCAANNAEREKYVARIRAAYADVDGPDRLHAVETLAKLQVPVLQTEPTTTEDILRGDPGRLFVYTVWAASIDSDRYHREFKTRLLALATAPAAEDILRLQAAFALRNLRQLSAGEWNLLAEAALREKDESMAKIYLLSAACFNTPPDSFNTTTYHALRANIMEAKDAPTKGARMEAANVLAEQGGPQDVEALTALLNNIRPLNSGNVADTTAVISSPENADVRSSAAFAILRIAQRLDEPAGKKPMNKNETE